MRCRSGEKKGFSLNPERGTVNLKMYENLLEGGEGGEKGGQHSKED